MCFVSAQQLPPMIDLDELFKEAEARTEIKREAVAAMQNISFSQWSQQLHGQGHVSFGRVFSLVFHPDKDGRRFVVGLIAVVCERLGIDLFDEFAEAALTVALGLRGKLRMARAALRSHQGQQEERKEA